MSPAKRASQSYLFLSNSCFPAKFVLPPNSCTAVTFGEVLHAPFLSIVITVNKTFCLINNYFSYSSTDSQTLSVSCYTFACLQYKCISLVIVPTFSYSSCTYHRRATRSSAQAHQYCILFLFPLIVHLVMFLPFSSLSWLIGIS